MRFIADSMMGKLARWLRLSGYDVLYSRYYSDEEVLNKAAKRVILTRDAELAEKALKSGREVILFSSNSLQDQLRQLIRNKGIVLKETPENSRCPLCNGEIKKLEKGKVKNKVPGGILAVVEEFWECRDCGKIYWHGSHWDKIKKTVRDLMKE
jgi:hypothetical protein